MASEITVIVVAHNEEAHIAACLQSILEQSIRPQQVVVVDGNSNDRTQEICEGMVKQNDTIKYIRSNDPNQSITKNRNIGLRSTESKFVAFTDADCCVPADWLVVLQDELTGKGEATVAGVGGANIAPPDAPPFVRAVAAVQASRLGFIGSAQGGAVNGSRAVPSLSCTNVLLRKSDVIAAGGFNERLGNMGEDYELGFRLRKMGRTLLYVPRSYVWHNLRATPRKFVKNMYQYGTGRIRLMKRLFDFPIKYFLPMVFLIVIALSLTLAIIWTSFLIIPVGYVLVIFAYSVIIGSQRKIPSSQIFVAFLCLHFGYALGEFVGLIRS